MIVKAFIKAQYAKNRIFTHFEVAVVEDPVSKNNFHASEVCKYVSNMSQVIKIIFFHGPYSHSEASISLLNDLPFGRAATDKSKENSGMADLA